MSYSIQSKIKASNLRKRGYSIREIAKKLDIAVGTASAWVTTTKLTSSGQQRLKRRKIFGQFKTAQIRKQKSQKQKEDYEKQANALLIQIPKSQGLYKLLASFLIWTEGGKHMGSYLSFINSDPVMIKTYVTLLRKAFLLDKGKIRALMHLHEYHNEEKQKMFWSKITKIPKKQFSKTYIKPHTGKRIREGYPGSLRVRYYDVRIALELKAIYNTFAHTLGA